MGQHTKGKSHIYCRRCGKHAYHKIRNICAKCGYGKSTRMRSYSWQIK